MNDTTSCQGYHYLTLDTYIKYYTQYLHLISGQLDQGYELIRRQLKTCFVSVAVRYRAVAKLHIFLSLKRPQIQIWSKCKNSMYFC